MHTMVRYHYIITLLHVLQKYLASTYMYVCTRELLEEGYVSCVLGYVSYVSCVRTILRVL